MGCAIENQKKQLNIQDLQTCSKNCSKKNMEQTKNNDQSSDQSNKQMNENKMRTDTLVISTSSLCYEIIHSDDKAKLRIINYYIDLDGRILSKQKKIKNEKLDFQFSLENNSIRIRRNILMKNQYQ